MKSPSNEAKDRLFANPMAKIGKFAFDDSVAEVFDDMIRRSVPGYAMTLSLMPLIANRFSQRGTIAYDLGCSTGAGMISVARGLPESVSLLGMDSSRPMLDRCQSNLRAARLSNQWNLDHADIANSTFPNACIVLLNFTLQFIPVESRLPLLTRIASGLREGGVLLLSEKVVFKEPGIQESLERLHHDFKRENGYTELEVSQKRAAIEDMLIPESIEDHKTRIEAAGFSRCEVWLQCFNFVSILAIK